MRISHLAGASALALTVAAFAGVAYAADTQPGVGDIVVTATREKSLLSKTPIAMSAVTGEALRTAGVTGPADLRDVSPNISIDHTDGLQITIRGVTSTDQTEKGDPSAAFMLDGVYIARTQAADVSFFDIDRVEVLRGPQGTLYGRNTTAGVVNVITNKPKLGAFQADINAGAGNYSAYNVDGMVNLPLGDMAAVRAAVSYDRHDSYVNAAPGDTMNIGPQRDNYAGRLQLLFKPTDKITLLLRGDYAKIHGVQAAGFESLRQSNFYSIVGNPASGPATATWLDSSPSSQLTRANHVATPTGILGDGTDYNSNNTSYSLEGELNWDLGLVTATNILSYRHFARNESQTFDLGAPIDFPGAFNGTYHQVSEELRFATNSTGPLKVQAGFYYFHEHEDIALYLYGLLNGTPGATGYVYGFPQTPVINRTVAGFAQATYKPIESVRITAGMRYTDDYKYRYGHTVIEGAVGAPIAPPDYVNDAAIKSHRLTWRVGVDADVPGGLAYGTISTGYKAGGFGDGCSTGAAGQSNVTSEGEACVYSAGQPQAIYYQPETLTAYEIGYKGHFADNTIRFNASAFYYDYKNLQLSGVVDVAGAPSLVTTNAGKASVKGIELEGSWVPNEHHHFTAGLDLLDAHYTQYCGHYNIVGTTATCNDDWSGLKLDRSPSTVFRASYDFTLPLADGKVDAKIGTRVTSSYVNTAFYSYPLQFATPTHTTTDVSLTYTAAGQRYYVQAFAKNLENFITVNGVNTFGGVSAVGEPRTYGIRVGAKF